MTEPRVVVVGGGLAGLAAALACADGGARVTVLERSPRLGGAVHSFRRAGLWADNGQHVFLRCCTAYRGFLRRIGAEPLTTMQRRLEIPVVSPRRTAWIRRSGLPAPLHLAGGVARYAHLTPGDRIRLLRPALALARLDLTDTALDARTFGSWLEEHGQSSRAIAALWELFSLPAVNLPASEASLALAAKVFQTGLLTRRGAADIGYARKPLGEVHGDASRRALEVASVEVRLRAGVSGIDAEGQTLTGVQVDGEIVAADAAIVTVPHDRAASLLPPHAGLEPDRLRRLGTSPIVNVHVVYDRPVTDLPFAAGFGTPVQWVFDRTAASGLHQGQYLAISLSGADRYQDLRTEELRQIFLPALEAIFPRAAPSRVETFFVTRERQATFRQAPGTAALRPGPRTDVAGLFVAGAWTDTGWPATMEGAVRSGIAAAREALIALGRTRRLPKEVAA